MQSQKNKGRTEGHITIRTVTPVGCHSDAPHVYQSSMATCFTASKLLLFCLSWRFKPRRHTVTDYCGFCFTEQKKKATFFPRWLSTEFSLTADFAAFRSPLPSRRCTAAMASSFRRSFRPRCPAAGLSAAIPGPNRSSRPPSASSLRACAAFLAVETEAEHNHEYIY